VTQTGGLDLLFAWLIFGALLAVLLLLLLRRRPRL
jgi:LPXTG-motif cell wall-anchored protein